MWFIHCRLLLEMPVPVASSLNRGSAAVCVLLALEWRWSAAKRTPSARHARRVSYCNFRLLHRCRICLTCLVIISVVCSRGWKIYKPFHCDYYFWKKSSWSRPNTIFMIWFPGMFSSSESLGPCQPCAKCPSGVPTLASCSAAQDTQCECDDGFFFFGTYGLCAPCSKCNRGEGAVQECGPKGDTQCQICGAGTFSEEVRSVKPCQTCTKCSDSEVEIRACMPNSDTLCMGE